MSPHRIARGLDAAELRRAFDEAFAEAAATDTVLTEDVLDVKVGGAPYALRISELAGLVADAPLTPIASPVPEWLGVVGLRGTVVPVYDLGALLGQGTATAPRWLAIASGKSPVGVAFELLERHRRVPAGDIVTDAGPDLAARHVQQLLRENTGLRPVISVPSIVEWVAHRAGADRNKGAARR
jgi:purine-binding chemotaxis protein CheW